MSYEATNHNDQFDPRPLDVEDDGSVNQVWEEYLAGTNLSYDAVYSLWRDPQVTNPIVRQRIVTVLTAPEEVELPYSRVDMAPVRLLRLSANEGKELSEEVAVEPALAAELASGVLCWLEATEGSIVSESYRDRGPYLEIMTQLMRVVNQDVADKLFSYYPLAEIGNNGKLIIGITTHSFGKFFYSRSTPQRYKEAIFDYWSQQVQQQLADHQGEADEPVKALAAMAHVVDWDGGREDVDVGLHERLINFLQDHVEGEQPYIKAHSIPLVANNIADPELKYTFVRRHLTRVISDPTYASDYSQELFHVSMSDYDREFVEWVQAQSIQRDDELLKRWSSDRMQLYTDKQRRSASYRAARLALLRAIRQV